MYINILICTHTHTFEYQVSYPPLGFLMRSGVIYIYIYDYYYMISISGQFPQVIQ